MKYSEIRLTFLASVSDEAKEILIAELGELGCDSFMDEGRQLSAYIQTSDLEETKAEITSLLDIIPKMTYQIKEMEDKNWNEEWESNFDKIIVNDSCAVRAPFHEPLGYETEIVIMPRMAFGTGHHQTTQLMIEEILKMELSGKKGLDMGCGTGVLAIAALIKGASFMDAIDIDEWAYDNVIENGENNGVKDKIQPFWGDASLLESGELKDARYDVIFANINRNILIRDMEIYVSRMAEESAILFSGFLEDDVPLIRERGEALGLDFVEYHSKDKWFMVKFVKNILQA